MSLKFSTFHDDELMRAGGWLSLIRRGKRRKLLFVDVNFFSVVNNHSLLSWVNRRQKTPRAGSTERFAAKFIQLTKFLSHPSTMELFSGFHNHRQSESLIFPLSTHCCQLQPIWNVKNLSAWKWKHLMLGLSFTHHDDSELYCYLLFYSGSLSSAERGYIKLID